MPSERRQSAPALAHYYTTGCARSSWLTTLVLGGAKAKSDILEDRGPPLHSPQQLASALGVVMNSQSRRDQLATAREPRNGKYQLGRRRISWREGKRKKEILLGQEAFGGRAGAQEYALICPKCFFLRNRVLLFYSHLINKKII
jgi:hypothetical protein